LPTLFYQLNQMDNTTFPFKMKAKRQPKIHEIGSFSSTQKYITTRNGKQSAFRSATNYYILHGTEPDWNPYLNSPIENGIEDFTGTKKQAMENMIAFQAKELKWLAENNPNAASKLSLSRLKDYISTRITEYTDWNGEWY
jgi:hypothetical protein